MKSTLLALILSVSILPAVAQQEERIFAADGFHPIKVENRVSFYSIKPDNIISIHKVNCDTKSGNSVPVMRLVKNGIVTLTDNDVEVVEKLNTPPKNKYADGVLGKAVTFLCDM